METNICHTILAGSSLVGRVALLNADQCKTSTRLCDRPISFNGIPKACATIPYEVLETTEEVHLQCKKSDDYPFSRGGWWRFKIRKLFHSKKLVLESTPSSRETKPQVWREDLWFWDGLLPSLLWVRDKAKKVPTATRPKFMMWQGNPGVQFFFPREFQSPSRMARELVY